MELRRYLAILRRRAPLIAITIIVALAVTVVRTDRTARYTARTTIYVGASNFANLDKGYDPRLSGDQANGLIRLINTFAVMLNSQPIAQDALNLTKAPRSAATLVAETTVLPVLDANILEIKVTDTDPALAQALSAGLADAFVQKIGDFEPGRAQGAGDIPAAPVHIFERATLPSVPARTSLASNLLVAAIFGFLLAVGLILLVEYLDVTVKSPGEAEGKLDLPVLGVVPVLSFEGSSMLRRAPPIRSATPRLGQSV